MLETIMKFEYETEDSVYITEFTLEEGTTHSELVRRFLQFLRGVGYYINNADYDMED